MSIKRPVYNSKFVRALREGDIIHVDSLDVVMDKGVQCNCRCPECQMPVQFVFRKRPFKTKCFRHHVETTCSGGPMTALHWAAQKILGSVTQFEMKAETLFVSNGLLEHPLEQFRADVYCLKDNVQPLVLEVVVNSELTEDKIRFLIEKQIEAIKFDLTKVSLSINDDDLRHLLINAIDIKSNIFRHQQEKEKKPLRKPDDNGLFVVVGIALLAFIAWLFRTPNYYRKRIRRR